MASETKELHEARLRLRGVVTAIAVSGSSDELMDAMLAAEQRLIAAARTPPPEDGPVLTFMRGKKGSVLYAKGGSGPNDWIMLDGRIARLLDSLALTPGECRAFRLVPVREGVADA